MPFDWYHPDVPPDFAEAPDKARQMYEQEMGERAALLLRLGYTREETRQRLRGNARWDFEMHCKPSHLDRVDALVDEVYSHGGFAGGGPPMLE